MIYSRFDWDTGKFDYYDGPGDQLGNRPRQRKVLNQPKSNHGVPVEAVMPVIPPGARRVGSGVLAKGRIAVMPSEVMSPRGEGGGMIDASMGLGGFGADLESNPLVQSPWTTLGLWFGAFLIGYKVISSIAKG